jgi:hypothetical protein
MGALGVPSLAPQRCGTFAQCDPRRSTCSGLSQPLENGLYNQVYRPGYVGGSSGGVNHTKKGLHDKAFDPRSLTYEVHIGRETFWIGVVCNMEVEGLDST